MVGSDDELSSDDEDFQPEEGSEEGSEEQLEEDEESEESEE